MKDKIKSITLRLLTEELDYFDEQFMYGHREVLLHELVKTGNIKDGNFMLHAGLQHGWLSEEGVWRVRNRNLKKCPRYVWNMRWETHLPSNTFNVAIGSPWLYFLRSVGFTKEFANWKKLTKKKFLVFPGHSGLSLPKNQVAQATYFSKIADPTNSTVCLFWLDFCNPTIRESFEEQGFEVKCVGFGSARERDAKFIEGGRTNYFVNLLKLFLTHEIIVTDEISSGQLYAIAVGLKLIYAPNQESFKFSNEVIKTVKSTNPLFQKTSHEWVEKFAPGFLATKNVPESFVELAWEELGQESLLSVQELLSLNWIEMDSSHNLDTYLLDYSRSLSNLKIVEYFS